MAIPTWKIFPALTCGNGVVFKPASDVPATGTALVEILLEAGVPPKAINLVHGTGSSVGTPLVEHPDVVEAAAVAAPDADRGSIVKAYVVLRDGVPGDDALVSRLQEHVKRVTAPYKYPRAVEFVAELPKTVSGKIRRVELRQRAGGADPG